MGNISCLSKLKHCERETVELDGQIWKQCYDNVRIVKGNDSNSTVNDNFYDKNENINDKCINQIYDSNGKRINDDKLMNNCKEGCILSTHNDTNICIKPNFINENTFFDNKFCRNIKNEFNCDFTPNCFWENNNC